MGKERGEMGESVRSKMKDREKKQVRQRWKKGESAKKRGKKEGIETR